MSYTPSKSMKVLIYISGVLLAALVAFNIAYYVGSKHGHTDGRLYGTYDCMVHMNKLAETLTDYPEEQEK